MHDTNDFFYGFLNILYPEACMNEWLIRFCFVCGKIYTFLEKVKL